MWVDHTCNNALGMWFMVVMLDESFLKKHLYFDSIYSIIILSAGV